MNIFQHISQKTAGTQLSGKREEYVRTDRHCVTLSKTNIFPYIHMQQSLFLEKLGHIMNLYKVHML